MRSPAHTFNVWIPEQLDVLHYFKKNEKVPGAPNLFSTPKLH